MHLLVIRASAMGDVALTTPVLKAIRKKYPDTLITIVTRPAFVPFFSPTEGLNIFMADFNGRHKGLTGIFNLYSDLKKLEKIDHVIDLHDVLRSKILGKLFRISGIPVSVTDKGRSEKKLVIQGKIRTGLKHTVDRYCDTFSKAGFPVIPGKEQSIIPADEAINKISVLPVSMDDLNIGVAPYAKHELKMWPEEYMIMLLRLIAEKQEVKYWLFGGKEDTERLNSFHEKVPGSSVVSGKYDLSAELALMSRLDLMISMDSANMHMAALTGTKVVSIWGGTDPITGFGAWQQPDDYAVRIPAEELSCRPCTIYGKGKCRRGDFACMIWLTPEKVFEKIINLKIV